MTGTIPAAHTSQEFPPSAPNKAQPWPVERTTVAAPLLTPGKLPPHTGLLLGACPNQNLVLLIPALPSPLNLEQHPGVTPGHKC